MGPAWSTLVSRLPSRPSLHNKLCGKLTTILSDSSLGQGFKVMGGFFAINCILTSNYSWCGIINWVRVYAVQMISCYVCLGLVLSQQYSKKVHLGDS